MPRRLVASLRLFVPLAALILAVTVTAADKKDEKKAAEKKKSASVTWKQCLGQKAEWYGSDEAVRVADNLLFYQSEKGGWDKNMDMAATLTKKARAEYQKYKSGLKEDHSTIDNSSTYTQLRYLARVYSATKIERFLAGFNRGLDLLFQMQYPNGGWPQFAFRKGYYTRITFNDNAMIGVMKLMRDIAAGYGEFAFVDSERRARAAAAVQKGIDCILKCQVREGGKLTAWCAQHDEKTMEPTNARAYELASLSGAESVEIVRFLIGVKNPSPEVRQSIEAAVAWFEQVKVTGLRETRKIDPALPKGWDKVMVADPGANPLWARFYEIGTNRPFFCGRAGVKKYALADIEYERRNGYSWYTESPASLLQKDYPAWRARWGGH